ncbi:MAG: ankyrin repeat domain-containing protein [Gammaproteobacteria bacterium]
MQIRYDQGPLITPIDPRDPKSPTRLEIFRRDYHFPKLKEFTNLGICHGLTGAWLACSAILETQSDSKDINERDDLLWFSKTIESFLQWDGKTKLDPSEVMQIKKLLEIVSTYYEEFMLLHFDQIFEKIKSAKLLHGAQPVDFKCEYTLQAPFFTVDQLASIIPQIIHPQRKVEIFTAHHTVGLILREDHVFQLFDPNQPTGVLLLRTPEEVAQNIFNMMFYNFSSSLPLMLFINSFSHGGMKPVFYPKQVEILAQLLKGKDLNQPVFSFREEGALLYFAVCYHNRITMQYLLSQKADVNAVNRAGETPLMKAVEINFIDGVKMLLDNRALPNLIDVPYSSTALHRAAGKGYKNIAEILVKYGADIHLIDRFGNSPPALARMRGFSDCATAIERAALTLRRPSVSAVETKNMVHPHRDHKDESNRFEVGIDIFDVTASRVPDKQSRPPEAPASFWHSITSTVSSFVSGHFGHSVDKSPKTDVPSDSSTHDKSDDPTHSNKV